MLDTASDETWRARRRPKCSTLPASSSCGSLLDAPPGHCRCCDQDYHRRHRCYISSPLFPPPPSGLRCLCMLAFAFCRPQKTAAAGVMRSTSRVLSPFLEASFQLFDRATTPTAPLMVRAGVCEEEQQARACVINKIGSNRSITAEYIKRHFVSVYLLLPPFGVLHIALCLPVFVRVAMRLHAAS
ncbi:hypothetical protein K437DRAFT_125277 [Tilletiaria anomala UBC 951]|uniref:Uncharacterized protein n=1 Tax=Tilletiaria anomala (strain ATCC 24038 / CBS 436.72 / UBC 951) TaxID=1037660 RepID=A0A066VTL5_TILAU|nr:uncharacterized protein K437DRAFT_125277 [Tilletiaria anomala UBC 951]KDN45067.1 hypothetical protein K437DRAFT_125277 [Tilletiaria anomala UBC 951]